MNFGTLKFALIIAIAAWSQICCCQAWAMMAVAQRAAVHQAPLATIAPAACCSQRDHAPGNPGTPAAPEPATSPCHEHSSCAGCLPRLGWIPVGPSGPSVDTIGEHLPPVPAFPWTNLAGSIAARDTAVHCIRCDAGPPCGDPPTLVRLHCALIV
jgi:hypothetical protein